jgi:hypothetical protein
MNIAAWLLAALVSALLSAGGGYWFGRSDGMATQQAKQDHKAVADLNGIIESHTGLIGQANAASLAMRQATARREAVDRKSTKELRDALVSTADSRAGCVFGADVLRQLQAARDRAAESAASGIRSALPAAASSANAP